MLCVPCAVYVCGVGLVWVVLNRVGGEWVCCACGVWVYVCCGYAHGGYDYCVCVVCGVRVRRGWCGYRVGVHVMWMVYV